ncbi:intracellular ribonuclease LX-like isoform X2 [Nicotiana tabacum]|uniref:Intracellular ribonuclease LX-like isoform X2 n=2 Tax=Nicotiana TaxID=4085 RepID=A0A1S3XUV2_TOBAC|nr:PREDICTED: intracellular ribonuclease LX-like isoform X2 [Nicotiana sylvestris]XP_016443726.1 PREDICTED: intracellular ribonuclease LX-like isoform X2 [Nicotiana tabacum]
MRSIKFVLVKLVIFQCITLLVHAKDLDFYRLTLQWNPAACYNRIIGKCCNTTTGRPAEDFGIAGLWPSYNNLTYPENCNKAGPYDETQISDLLSSMQKNWPKISCPSNNGTSLWAKEWKERGTCSRLNMHSYFETALDLKEKLNLIQDVKRYAIKLAIGHVIAIECNLGLTADSQFYRVHICVDKSGSDFIDCPINLTEISETTCSSSTKWSGYDTDSVLEERSAYSWARK